MSDSKLILLAAGGHGRVVLDALLAQELVVAGVLDPALPAGANVLGVPVLGADAWLLQADPRQVQVANGGGATPTASLRQRLYQQWTQLGFVFVSVRHPSAVVARSVELAPACQLMAGAVVQTGARIGVNAVVNTHASVDHDCELGAHAFLAPGVVLCGGVRVGERAFVGAGAVVLPGLAIGADAVVGAGATVTHDVPAGACVLGTPAMARGKHVSTA
jgi:UDP-perosamine 4-acetyltransferase